MDISFTPTARFQLSTLGEENRRVVVRWIGRLVDWENDYALRTRAKRLPGDEDVYVLKAGPDWRVFFELRWDRITIRSIDSRETVELLTQAQGREPS